MARVLIALLASLLLVATASAAGLSLAPYKDRLFEYRRVLESGYGGDFLRVAYVEQRDLFNRDDIPQRKVSGSYVSLATRAVEKDLVLKSGGLTVKYTATGRTEGGAKIVVIFLHGKNVTRALGANDWMFGGNFNRIKNLMMLNGGVYISPDFSDFKEKGAAEIKALVAEYARNSPGAPIYLACGSMGGYLCWRLAEDPSAASMLSGLLLLGTDHDDGLLSSPAGRARLPVFIGHGTRDTVYDWKKEVAFFKRVKAAAPDYPIRLVLFDTGVHGTPIRMVDWRRELNWMLAVGGK